MYLDEDKIKDYNFLMLCNNYIVSILEQADLKKWSEEKMDFKDKDKKKLESNKYDIFYFRNHGYATVINKSLYKHIIFSLISDYNIYVKDAIDCCLKGHFSVAYTLLRKPFKDDLFMIELFYVSGYRIISKFANSSIENFRIESYSENEKKKVLRKVCKKINFFTAKKLYDLRYSSNSYEGLEKFWNKAIHIVTSRKNYKTEDANFNMIFYDDNIVAEQITYIYKVLCSIQLYFIVLISNILLEEQLITENEYNFNINNLFYAFCITLDNYNLTPEQKDSLIYVCKYCGCQNIFNNEQFMNNYNKGIFKRKCDKCNRTYEIKKFDFYDFKVKDS